jgi:DNA-directed RNA polymerase specialized sigma subunit
MEKEKRDLELMNQREVAEALGVSRTAIQQIEKRAFKKIKRYFAQRNINPKDYIGE